VTTLDHIGRLERFQEVPDDGPMCDLLCSDPEAKFADWARSDLGGGVFLAVATGDEVFECQWMTEGNETADRAKI
jgi:diadenosine tetraphosphatase ApaH/serine/threonine PP2A family protein phosphatase